MTESTIQFELVSPEERLISAPMRMVVIPGAEGEFGVLAGHSSLVASLKPGVVRLYAEEQDDPRHVFVTGGFVDVTAELCTILAEEAVNVNDLDQDQLEQQLSHLSEDLELAEEAADKARFEKRIDMLKAKLSAVSGETVI